MRRVLLALLVLAASRPSCPQGTIYLAGDGVTTSAHGVAYCTTDPAALNVEDGVAYATASASPFAEFSPRIVATVPNPMGKDAPVATAGLWGVTVVNPGDQSLTVSSVRIDDGSANLFQAVAGVSPAAGWSTTQNVVSWAGTVDVAARSTFDFIVRVQGRGTNRPGVPITLQATTTAGVLTLNGLSTSQGNNNNVPYVGLSWVVNGSEAYSGSPETGGAASPADTVSFTVRLRESEQASVAIPAGATLFVWVPPGWSDVQAASPSGFSVASITQPDAAGCTWGAIQVQTTTPILGSSRDFPFTAKAPPQRGSTGIYVFAAHLVSTAVSPQIDTWSGFNQVIQTPPVGATRAGLTAPAAYVAVPKPMGNNRNSTWGVALANPTDVAIEVVEVQVQILTGDPLFANVTGIRPASGWSRLSPSLVHWTGSVTIPPHDASAFVASIQANGRNEYDVPVRAAVLDSLGSTYLNSDATTSEDGGLPSASLYFDVLGQPSLYTFAIASGQPRQFQVTIEEKQGVNIAAGSTLSIVVPRGFSAVSASAQTGFTAPVVTQPTALGDGLVQTTLSPALRGKRRTFSFSATSPPDLLESLFVFPAALTGGRMGALCQALVQVVDTGGGLEVQHVSPSVVDTTVNQIDVEVIATSSPAESYRLEAFDFTTGSWSLLWSGDVGSTPTTLGGSITSNFAAFFDPLRTMRARITSNAKSNHHLDEDYAAFILSNYRVTPTSLAPPTASQGRQRVPLEKLRFDVDLGTVGVETLAAQLIGPAVAGDVTLVHLYQDSDCDGFVTPTDVELAPGAVPDGGGGVIFGVPGSSLFTIGSAQSFCAVVAVDVAPAATVGDLFGITVPTNRSITSDLGPYPFPCPAAGYPIRSGDVLITDRDTDNDGLTDVQELALGTFPNDADSDDDGITDGVELGGDGAYNSGVDTDPMNPDTDGDGLQDGTEEGVGEFANLADFDRDGTPDVVDPDPIDPDVKGTDMRRFQPDLDGASTTDPLDDDTDDDGIKDGNEDADHNGRVDGAIGGSSTSGSGETDPNALDSDGDGIPDGIEGGLTAAQGLGTNPTIFRPDADPSTTTSPVDIDSDNDGISDGREDVNRDGARAPGELDPLDADTDDDGILDGLEVGPDGIQGPGETSALLADTDGDGLLDGTEIGVTRAVADPDGPGPLKGTDLGVFVPDADPATQTNPLDDDTDDDGIPDGVEDANHNGQLDSVIAGRGTYGSGGAETEPLNRDTDGDGLLDGTEIGLAAPLGTGTNMAVFRPDLDPATRSNPLDDDSDDDGIADGVEDANHNGRLDSVIAGRGTSGGGGAETDPLRADTDGDGLLDGTEIGLQAPLGSGTNLAVFRADLDPATRTDPLDDDSDDDGVPDGVEDANHDGRSVHVIGATGTVGSGETDPLLIDTDGDGCQDGTEMGYAAPQAFGTNPAVFHPDLDPASVTSPLDTDSDDDGLADGQEDTDCNGRIDPGESNPATGGAAVLRSDLVASVSGAHALYRVIFAAAGGGMDLRGPNGIADPGEGVDRTRNGSDDDDACYVLGALRPWTDADAVLGDRARPLVFYATDVAGNGLRAAKSAGSVLLTW